MPRGYAVALADVRGTGESGGCLEQTGPLRSQDGYETVEWLASQEWSSGKVGMYGKSYDAATQQSTATLAPPHLTTIIPVSSVAGNTITPTTTACSIPSAQHRNGLQEPGPVSPGSPESYQLHFFPSGAGSAHRATLTGVTLTIPAIPSATQLLAIPLGEPITRPVT